MTLEPERLRWILAAFLCMMAGSAGTADDEETAAQSQPPSEDQTLEPLGSAGRHAGSARPSHGFSEQPPEDGFLPIEDRWRIGFPPYDRYGRRDILDPYFMGAPSGDYPYVEGHWLNPYAQNVLKGDYPIYGQHLFMNLTFTSDTLYEYRRLPTPSGESTKESGSLEFFGDPDQEFLNQNLIARLELFHGDAAFKPFDWKVRVTPILNFNTTNTEERGVINVDLADGTIRRWEDFALQEAFFEAKLQDVSPNYDFLSLRVGRQPFVSDFRGFIFNDVNQGIRLFSNADANQSQWNFAFFIQAEKDTNSELNRFRSRDQKVLVVNYYRQDSLDWEILPPSWRKGFTTQLSFHYNEDLQEGEDLHFDRNGFLTRPDPIGSFRPHDVRARYLGWTGDGHIGRLNLSCALYWVTGRDDFNPIAGRKVRIGAQMAAVETSVDVDWLRFRGSFLWASGDREPQDSKGRGFDAILDNPNFAGGPFSFWQRQGIRLLGVNLVNRASFLPDLTASKLEGQSNFVNPGLWLVNAGMDAELTPKWKAIFNTNVLWFNYTKTLALYLQQPDLDRQIGLDVSLGTQYRPLLNNNVIFNVGLATLFPGNGFQKIYEKDDPLVQAFAALTLTF